MRTIVLGKVTHPGKSYAYHLGYTAGMMGYITDHSPYSRPDQVNNHKDFLAGHRQAVQDSNAAIDKWLEEHGNG